MRSAYAREPADNRAVFAAEPAVMAAQQQRQYTFDVNEDGAPPRLSDKVAQEKGASIAMNAILQSESLMRALGGASADFQQGLTLLLPTNRAFQSLESIPDDLELVMKRHFIPQMITSEQMAKGATVQSYEDRAALVFSSKQGKTFVQADQRPLAEIRGAGTQVGDGIYFLVDSLFT
ncbi:hypothetical protein GGF46_001027 [Coemansia sp. RSA 552]|nr:hypothetical protein GGF46_001027 [Coemansia sp. RSA 552]